MTAGFRCAGGTRVGRCWLLLGGVCALALLWGCASRADAKPTQTVEQASGQAIRFAFTTTKQETFSSRSTRGRATALLFVTTYDLASQVQARRLDRLLRRHRPRANGAAVVLESAEYAVLAEAYRTSLGLSFPVCVADEQTRIGRGPFGRIGRVPTLVVLDRSGVEVWRNQGLATVRETKKALATASRRGSPFAL